MHVAILLSFLVLLYTAASDLWKEAANTRKRSRHAC